VCVRCGMAERARGARPGSARRASDGRRRAPALWTSFPYRPPGRCQPKGVTVIVEIAGCSGSGKSTLLKEVLRQCAERGLSVATAEDVALPGLPRAIRRNPTRQNL